MKRLLRVLGWILGVLVVAWVGACAYLAMTHPRVTFTAEELARPATSPEGLPLGHGHVVPPARGREHQRLDALRGAAGDDRAG